MSVRVYVCMHACMFTAGIRGGREGGRIQAKEEGSVVCILAPPPAPPSLRVDHKTSQTHTARHTTLRKNADFRSSIACAMSNALISR